MTEEYDSPIFKRMWERRGWRAELRAANAMAIKQWRVELSYSLSILRVIVMPFLWFIPIILAGNAVTLPVIDLIRDRILDIIN